MQGSTGPWECPEKLGCSNSRYSGGSSRQSFRAVQTDVLTSCRQPGNTTRCGKSWCVPCGVLQDSSKTLHANCRATTHLADFCSHSRAVLSCFHLSFKRARAINGARNETGSGLSEMRTLTVTPWMLSVQSSRSLTMSRRMASFEFTRRTHPTARRVLRTRHDRVRSEHDVPSRRSRTVGGWVRLRSWGSFWIRLSATRQTFLKETHTTMLKTQREFAL